jgi:hypothetical protein
MHLRASARSDRRDDKPPGTGCRHDIRSSAARSCNRVAVVLPALSTRGLDGPINPSRGCRKSCRVRSGCRSARAGCCRSGISPRDGRRLSSARAKAGYAVGWLSLRAQRQAGKGKTSSPGECPGIPIAVARHGSRVRNRGRNRGVCKRRRRSSDDRWQNEMYKTKPRRTHPCNDVAGHKSSACRT